MALHAVIRQCSDAGIRLQALQNGSRLPVVSRTRKILAEMLVLEYGLSLAETAKLIGITSSGVTKILQKTANESQ